MHFFPYGIIIMGPPHPMSQTPTKARRWIPLYSGQNERADQSKGFTGRRQDVTDQIAKIVFEVAPAELEDVLRGLAGVEDVAVIGVKSEREGEVPRAYIVRSSPSLTEDSVQEYMKVQVASHKQLVGGIQFVQSIPKSAAGKILRKDIKAMYSSSKIG